LIQNIHLFQKATFKHIRDIYEVTYDIKVKQGEFVIKIEMIDFDRSSNKVKLVKSFT